MTMFSRQARWAAAAIVAAGAVGISGAFALSSASASVRAPRPAARRPHGVLPGGKLFTTDATANTIDSISGPLKPGTAYTAVTPCKRQQCPGHLPGTGVPG